MNIAEVKELLEKEVPVILRESPGFKMWLQDFIRSQTVTPESFDERFDRILREMAEDRNEQRRRWDEQDRKWDEQNEKWREQNRKWDEQNEQWKEQNRKWDEQNRIQAQKWEEQDAKWDEQNRIQAQKWEEQHAKWDEQNEKWREQNRKWDEQNRIQAQKWDEQDAKWDEQNRIQAQKWDEQDAKWDEQNRIQAQKWDEQNRIQAQKWDEQNRKWDENLKEIRSIKSKNEQSIGALGSRWGLASEESFRSALRGILHGSFGVDVINVNEFDDEGLVFGQPDQVELDIIIKNGTLILCELKSSMSKGDMYTFDRKCTYYERKHQRRPDRKIVVSPMVDKKAQDVAQRLDIEVFTFAEDVDNLP